MPKTPNETVRYANEAGVATITLDRPKTLNSMNEALMRDLTAALGFVAEDESARVVVITGEGHGFCSGADLGSVAGFDDEVGERVKEIMDGVFHPAIRALMQCPVPTIARVNGVAAGGGLGLALGCDVAIAGSSASFVATFGPRLGIVPDFGTTWSLPRRIGRARALGMSMLGEKVDAMRAEAWGLIWKAVDDDALDGEVARVADILRRTSPSAMTRIRACIDDASAREFDDHIDVEMAHQVELIPRNMVGAAKAFMEKREPEFGPRRD